jgi:hypothetical protein
VKIANSWHANSESCVQVVTNFHFHFQFVIFNALLFIGPLTRFVNGQTPRPTPPPDVDVIRTETDLTNLLFTVTDKNNRYITTLQQSDIRVIEDGVPQALFTFQRETDRPLSIAFLIDVSISEGTHAAR